MVNWWTQLESQKFLIYDLPWKISQFDFNQKILNINLINVIFLLDVYAILSILEAFKNICRRRKIFLHGDFNLYFQTFAF